MSPDQPASLHDDDVFAQRLADLDEALATGTIPTNGETPHEVSDRVRRGLGALQALQHLRPDRGLEPTIGWTEARTLSELHPGPAPLRLGRFHVLRELGRGGFGIVFLAHDPKLHREVALKVPHTQALIDDHLRERFRREAQAAAGLNHANIVPVYEVDEQGPIRVLVSEYCPGVTLSEWLAKQTTAVSPDDVASLIAALADGVAHAHEKGVLHRDLKPANILMQLSDDHPKPIPKITDFGLAKLAGETGDMTKTGAVLGTPAYMAPEQARGKTASIDERADVYALGVILYELLTGRPPLRGETDVDTLQLVCHTEPVAPRHLRPKLPRDLETICLKCLQKDQAGRYASAAELRDDLRRFLNRSPVLARPISLAARSARWCRRHPAISALTLALLVSLILGVTGVVREFNRANRERDSALASANRITRLQGLGRDALNSMIDHGHQLVHAPATVREGISILEGGRRYYKELLDEDASDIALRKQAVLICRRLGMLYFERQMSAESDSAWDEAAMHAEALLDGPDGQKHRIDYIDLITPRAEGLYVSQRYNQVPLKSQRALEVARQEFAERPDDPETAWRLQGLYIFRIMAAKKIKNYADAQSELIEGLAVVRKAASALGSPRAVIAETNFLNHLSQLASNQNRLEEGEDYARQSVAVSRKAVEATPGDVSVHRSLAGSLTFLGRATYVKKNDWQTTIDSYREANKIFYSRWQLFVFEPGIYFEAALGAKLIASSLEMLERGEEAIPDLRTFLGMEPPPFRPGRLDPTTPDVFECYGRLADLLVRRGEIDEAKKIHTEAQTKLATVAIKTPLHEKAEKRLAAVAARFPSPPAP